MKSLIVKLVVAAMLFAGSLVGGLAATGRLDHEGTANIPVLNALFPAPPEVPGEHGDAAHGDAHDAAGHAAGGVPSDAAHGGGPGAVADASDQEPQGPVRMKTGRSVVEPEQPAGDGHGGGHGGGHGDEGGGDAHGGGHADGGQAKPAHGHTPPAAPGGEAAVRSDMQRLENDLAKDRHTRYAPGGFFRFDGMPAGLTPQQLNEAWQRVQGVMEEIERRRVALDLREQELQELADDISRRQAELGAERTKIDQLHRELDARIQKFQDTVKLVRNDEVAALKRNAQTLAAFEPSKAAEILMDQWKTEQGQDEILKVLEYMDKGKVNELLAELPNALVQDVLKKRMRVTKESAATDGRR